MLAGPRTRRRGMLSPWSPISEAMGAMRSAPRNGRQEQGKTTYSLEFSQNVLADTILVKVTFN